MATIKNNVQGSPISTVIGLIIISSALASVFLVPEITFVWDGIAAITVGGLFIFAKDSFFKAILSVINNK